jgi:carbonic anhydrase/acetyltransferase-like protein (isoleucine patch superfamily)
VAAATLVPEGMEIPPRSLVMGVPGKVRRQITEEEREGLRRYANNYFEYKESYLAELARR